MAEKSAKKISGVKSPKPNVTSQRISEGKKDIATPKTSISPRAKKLQNSSTEPLARVYSWLSSNARRLALFGGAAMVIIWTVIRHISNGINFDVVGQIGVAEQWAHGQMSGTQLGATNYLIKMPVYFLINTLHFLTPMNRILLAAILFNVATFILLFVIYEKILKLYQIKNSSWLYVSMAWLAAIAGNVFWVDYANSRNLETVGGIFFVYLVLKYLRTKTWGGLLALGATASFVFFADPIQMYVCGAGTVLFVIGRALFKPAKARAKDALAITTATVFGSLSAQIIMLLARKVLHVTFLVTPSTNSPLALSNLLDTLRGLVANTFTIFGANFLKRPYDANSIREILNAIIVVLLIAALVRIFIKTRKLAASGLVLAIIATNYLVYIASGQVLQWETSRYLIMVPLLVIILLVLRSDELIGNQKLKFQYLWWLAVGASSVLLIGALAHNWPSRHSKDTHIHSLVSFMDQHSFKYALSSRETGITTTYFSQGKAEVLPMSCEADHTLHPTNLFYDKAPFEGLYHYRHNIPIIIPSGGIRFGTNICTINNIFGQFGAPKKILNIPDVGLAAVYTPSRILLADFGQITGRSSPIKTKQAVIPSIGVDVSPASTIPKLEGCKNGTIDVVVAHPDDDILFMNPDLSNGLIDNCVRTVFVTAADAGRAQDYWMNRQRGIEAAYASMVGMPNDWSDNTAIIDNHTVLIRTLNGYPALSLVFMLLPDGGTGGKGFRATGNISLEALSKDKTAVAHTIDGSSSYTYDEVAKIVGTIIATDTPNKIFTHVADGPLSIGDHSDHRAVGLLTIQARSLAKSNAALVQYVGYPSNGLLPNLPPEVANQKRHIFDVYASEDAVICISIRGCSIEGTYGRYFSRSYKLDSL